MADAIPASVTRLVDDRDLGYDRMHGRFIGRGRNLHHRKLRSRGGKHTAGNLITLAGSGTTGSHGWAHANPDAATHTGFMVPSWVDDPASVPIRLADVRGRIAWHRLLDNGRVVDLTDSAAEAAMRDLGIWQSGELF